MKQYHLTKRLTAMLLALVMVLGMLPVNALAEGGQTALQQTEAGQTEETQKGHELEFIRISQKDESHVVEPVTGLNGDGEFDFILTTLAKVVSGNPLTIAAKAAAEGEKVWAVTETKNPLLHAYQMDEVSSDTANPTEIKNLSNAGNADLLVIVGKEAPTIDKTNKLNWVIDYHQDVNTIYKVKVRKFATVDDLVMTCGDTSASAYGAQSILQPAFDPYTYEYEANVPDTAAKINFLIRSSAPREYYFGTREEGILLGKDSKNSSTQSFPVGPGTENDWDEDGNLILTICTMDGEEYGKEYKIILHKYEDYVPKIVEQSSMFNYVKSGETATLSVKADNLDRGTMTYQWYSNTENKNEGGTAIAGAVEAEYTPVAVDLSRSMFDREDYYYCVVTNTVNDQKYETVSKSMYINTSAPDFPVTLKTVDGSPIPEDGYEFYDEGESISGPALTVEFDETARGGNGTWSYQWQEGEKKASGSESYKNLTEAERICTLPVYTGGNEYTYQYRCLVTYTEGDQKANFYSKSVQVRKYNLTLHPQVEFSAQPQSASYVQGDRDKAALSVKAAVSGGSGKDEITYQWQESTDGENFQDIESHIEEYNHVQSSTSYFSADRESFYLSEDMNRDAYYRCKVVCTSTNMKGDTFVSEPVYSDIAHITYTPAFDDLTGAGTEDDPYLIGSLADLEKVRDKVNEDGISFLNVFFRLTADIALPGDWKSIGSSSSNRFSGTLDGKKENGGNHLITVAENGLPLFGFVGGAQFQNFDIYGKRINGYGLVNFYGISRGDAYEAVIDNVNLKSGTQTLCAGYIGGYASGVDDVIIRNCTVEEGVVIGYDRQQTSIGSFAGDINGFIENCRSYAHVYGDSAVGGLVGRKDQSMGYCTVVNSDFYGTVEATGEYVGGIVGSGYYSASAPSTPCVVIKNCGVYGTVKGKDRVGGIFGGEPVCTQCWSNGAGYIQDNYFGGKVESDGAYVGGIIGYMESLDVYNVIENNYFNADCGTEKGIGGVAKVDTDCETADRSDETVSYTNSKSYHRSDDPLGADRGKLTKSCTAGELADGSAAAALNKGPAHFNNWMPDQSGRPVHSDKKVAYKLTIRDIRGSGHHCYQGDDIDLSGIRYIVSYTDGTTEEIDGSLLTITGYDSSKTGSQSVTLSYGAASLRLTVNVQKRNVPDIKVTFSLLGDTDHGEKGSDVHTLKQGNLTEWIAPREYTVSGNATVLDVFTKALGENKMTFTNPTGNYIESITYKDTTLEEFTNGKKSGWMYTINGVHTDLGVSEQYLKDGDVIVFHYTDDYTKESSIGGEVLYGDADGDSKITVLDALTVLKYVVGTQKLDDRQIRCADVNGDGDVDVTDALQIIKKVAGSLKVFPVEEAV